MHSQDRDIHCLVVLQNLIGDVGTFITINYYLKNQLFYVNVNCSKCGDDFEPDMLVYYSDDQYICENCYGSYVKYCCKCDTLLGGPIPFHIVDGDIFCKKCYKQPK
jgi:formylmethanofuran dehydrogenase subunit E